MADELDDLASFLNEEDSSEEVDSDEDLLASFF